jgi:predicted DNA-binding transcriptional regulator AlpA
MNRLVLSPLVDTEEVRAMVRLSGRTIARLRAKKKFPAPIRLAGRRLLWRRKDIDQFLAKLPTLD